MFLIRKANPIQTLRKVVNCGLHDISTAHRSSTKPRKIPRLRHCEEDEYETFKRENTVTSFSEITKDWVKATLARKSEWKQVTAASAS